jgi:hypothetical protein
MYILAIDVEASGQGLQSNFMTCIGASLVDSTGKEIGSFSEYLAQPAACGWEQRCVDEFWSKHPALFEETKANVAKAAQPAIVMRRFRKWVLDITDGLEDVTIVFDTAGFDQAWVDYNLRDTSCLYLLGYYKQPRDLSSYLLGVTKQPFQGRGVKSYEEQFGPFPELERTHDHRPANDAYVIARRAVHVLTKQ